MRIPPGLSFVHIQNIFPSKHGSEYFLQAWPTGDFTGVVSGEESLGQLAKYLLGIDDVIAQ